MGNTITMVIVVMIGLAFFAWGLHGIRKNSMKENILDVIIDCFTGLFMFSDLGIMLFGLLLIILGGLELMGK